MTAVFNNPGAYNAHPPVADMMVKDGQYVFNPPASSDSDVFSWTPANYLDEYYRRMNETAEATNAASAAEAAKLRSWQEVQNQKAMDFNAAEAAKNRDWQEMMSNTAHQREVNDLIAAGLNPILSATGGNGAAVTSGATASGVTSAGAKGDVDMSRNQGIASLLGNMLQAQTSMLNTITTAQNNMAIAEKNNAMSELIARLNASNQYDIAKIYESLGIFQSLTSADASKYGADAARYGSALAYLASIYGSDMQYRIAEELPNTWAAMIERFLHGLGLGPSDAGKGVRNWIENGGNLPAGLEKFVDFWLQFMFPFLPDASSSSASGGTSVSGSGFSGSSGQSHQSYGARAVSQSNGTVKPNSRAKSSRKVGLATLDLGFMNRNGSKFISKWL